MGPARGLGHGGQLMKRSGVVLIEVLIALAILALTGLSTVSYVSTLTRVQTRGIEREAEMESAEELLIEHALLEHRELVQRLGARSVGSFVVWIDRPRPELFRVGIAPAPRPESELLATLLYRPVTQPEDGER